MSKRKFIPVGAVFGRLTVVRAGADKSGRTTSDCVCACGREKNVANNLLQQEQTKSCGCLQPQVTATRNRTHSKSRTAEYNIWCGMNDRCARPKNKSYANYGGRGITVCEQWKNSFDNFFADMGPRPSPKHSIDRYDNNGNYEHANCRWSTLNEQANNKRNNHRVTINGRTETIAGWSRLSGITSRMIQERLANKWPEDEAVWTPPNTRRTTTTGSLS